MSIIGALPTWAVGLLALGAGAVLLFVNYGWLLAVKAMLQERSRRGSSTADSPAGDRG